MWRDDNPGENNKKSPTIDTVVITAQDIVATLGIYKLIICHVRSFHGKGFMLSIRLVGACEMGSMQNSRVYRGTSKDYYDQVCAVGKDWLKEVHDKSEREYAESLAKQQSAE